MGSTINLRKKRKRWTREIIVVLSAVALTTVGIKASDKLFDNEEAVFVDSGACPSGMTLVKAAGGDFCIDIYEASAGAGCPYKDPGNQSASRDNLGNSACRAESVKGAAPWRNLSQDQAAIACARAGKRLPTNAEWQQAALGTPDRSSGWGRDDCQVSGNWQDQPGLAGFGKNCVSAAGAYDMIGNVWEWTAEAAIDGMVDNRELPPAGYIDSSDGRGLPGLTSPSEPNDSYYGDYFWLKRAGPRAIARGGYWDNGAEAGIYAAYAVMPPSAVGAGIGFRCVK